MRNTRLAFRASIVLGSLASALLGWACKEAPFDPGAPFDLTAFKIMARQSPCADLRNRLFLIDGRLVFWDRRGSCMDAAYAQLLFGRTVDVVLCRSQDSIAGRIEDCRDGGQRPLFETIIAHTDRADLGLGPAHRVQQIPF